MSATLQTMLSLVHSHHPSEQNSYWWDAGHHTRCFLGDVSVRLLNFNVYESLGILHLTQQSLFCDGLLLDWGFVHHKWNYRLFLKSLEGFVT